MSSILDEFSLKNINSGTPFVTITRNSIMFNKSVSEALGSPEYVQLYVSQETNRIAIKKCEQSDLNAVSFCKESGRATSVRWNNRDLANEFKKWCDLPNEISFRVDGVIPKEEEDIMIFDFKYKRITGDSTEEPNIP